MPAWSLSAGGGGSAEWFTQRFERARELIPAAEFDTIIPADFAETVTSELVDVTGVASADGVDFYSGGVVAVTAGDAAIPTCQGRLQLTGSPSHVGAGKSFYIASLVRMLRPSDVDVFNAWIDAIGLWSSDSNRLGLGVFGNGSGGSGTNWMGYADVDGSITAVQGPALDPEESPVWHLFEAWFDVDAELLSFALDGVPFDDTIAAANVPTGQSLKLSMISQRTDVGEPSSTNYDKACVVVASPRVGEPS